MYNNVLIQSKKFSDDSLDSVSSYSSFDPVNADAKPIFHAVIGRSNQSKMTAMMPFPIFINPAIFTGFSDKV